MKQHHQQIRKATKKRWSSTYCNVRVVLGCWACVFVVFVVFVVLQVYLLAHIKRFHHHKPPPPKKRKADFTQRKSQVKLRQGPQHRKKVVHPLGPPRLEKDDPNQPSTTTNKTRPGVIVLGMHRSGSSMLSGLLVTGFGYRTGDHLIGASFDNPKGFFERTDVVFQNDAMMEKQGVHWNVDVEKFQPDLALRHVQQHQVPFEEGTTALTFFHSTDTVVPYLQKDPRMCVTLPVWLGLLHHEPAVVFTYRHPLDVADSLFVREKKLHNPPYHKTGFAFSVGLHLWMAYNARAVQHSQTLCRVVSSNEALLADPRRETTRISRELVDRCGVWSPPHPDLRDEALKQFVDPDLQQHTRDHRKTWEDRSRVLARHRGASKNWHCVVYGFKTQSPPGSVEAERELDLYQKAMKMFCDFESGAAFQEGYQWPAL